MSDTLKWRVRGELFEDASQLSDWQKIEQSAWQWQYDTHELTFDIYEHDGDYWKLYRARWLPEGATEYVYGFGGQACRMVLVEYQTTARSPHSHKLMQAGNFEWVRTYEYDESIHRLIKAGLRSKSEKSSNRREKCESQSAS